MKKASFLLLLLIVFMAGVNAQAYEGTIQFDKKKQPAIVIEYAYPAEAVENAFIERMGRLGYRPKEEKGFLNKDKGFLVFKNAYVTEISDRKMDYIIKVDRKSRKESDESILYVILQEDGDNALQKLESYDIGRAKSYLNNMLPDIEAANLELQIKAQEELVARSEKKLRDLKNDQTALEKKLDENIKSQEETVNDIEEQKKTLDILTGKRRSN